MKTALRLLALLLVLAALGVAFIYSGLFDVAAATPDPGLVRWVLGTTQYRSVARRSASILPPRGLDDPARVRRGLVLYHRMCATCHGAPGVNVSEIGQGLNPEPPELAAGAGDDPREVFWIVKNGIKMTGMPGFGVTHGDDELWDVVAFLRKMPRLDPGQYQALEREAGVPTELGRR